MGGVQDFICERWVNIKLDMLRKFSVLTMYAFHLSVSFYNNLLYDTTIMAICDIIITNSVKPVHLC